MPNRYLRDAILTSERYLLCNPQERAFYVELLLNADDFGVVPINWGFLRCRCPSCGDTPEFAARMIAHLFETDLLRVYTVKTSQLAWIPRNGFRVKAMASKYKLPEESSGPAFNELKALAEKRLPLGRHRPPTDGHRAVIGRPTSTTTYKSKALPLSPVDNSENVDNSVDKSKTPDYFENLNPTTQPPPPEANPPPRLQALGAWWKTTAGIASAGQALGMRAHAGEAFDTFRERIFAKLREPENRT